MLADREESAWRFNHSPLCLDFLTGEVDLDCTPWAIPCCSVLDWARYGHASGDPGCRACLAHSGFEPSAVLRTLSSPRELVRAARETVG